jgi:hypothetical protein
MPKSKPSEKESKKESKKVSENGSDYADNTQQPTHKEFEAAAKLKRILANFAAINQRFNELDYAAASVSGSAASAISAPGTQAQPPLFGRVQSQDLGDDSPPPTDWGADQGVVGIPPAPPATARGESTGSFGSERSVASTASSVYESVIQDASSLLSPKDQADLAAASAAAAAVVDGGEVVDPLLTQEQKTRMLIDIDAAYDELMTDILNNPKTKLTLDVSSRIIRTLYRLVGLIMTAIGKGLGLAINYPKLAILIIGLGYLQYPLFARIVNFTVGSVWTILQYFIGMTRAGQTIAGFVRQIVGVYQWCVENGADSFAKFQQLVDIAKGLKEGLDELKALAAKLGISVNELVQIIISMNNAFGQSAPGSGRGEALWNLIGQFANGAGAGTVQALLGNGAGPGVPRLRGARGKSKTKTNKKRKSNKKGKTKTRRR